VVVYPPAPAGLSREKHVARLSLKSRQSVDAKWRNGHRCSEDRQRQQEQPLPRFGQN